MPMPKKVLIALPSALLGLIDYIALEEHRTRSDLVREALRRYVDNYKRHHHIPEELTRATQHPSTTGSQPAFFSAPEPGPAPNPPARPASPVVPVEGRRTPTLRD